MENKAEQTVEATDIETTEVITETEVIDDIQAGTEEINSLAEAQKALEIREAELFKREIKASLKESGLEQFEEVINVSNEAELKATVKKLTSIVNDIKVSLSYQPTENTKQDSYTVAKQNGDSKSMIKALFGNR
ncbi:hypothetical protein [Planococcus sp. YIM B11945]|uniref:hypothetical protein n=1 Tax=Planococcus sp. YIM B11945 TaxID=3435410 RepID=UPI003D7E2017